MQPLASSTEERLARLEVKADQHAARLDAQFEKHTAAVDARLSKLEKLLTQLVGSPPQQRGE